MTVRIRATIERHTTPDLRQLGRGDCGRYDEVSGENLPQAVRHAAHELGLTPGRTTKPKEHLGPGKWRWHWGRKSERWTLIVEVLSRSGPSGAASRRSRENGVRIEAILSPERAAELDRLAVGTTRTAVIDEAIRRLAEERT